MTIDKTTDQDVSTERPYLEEGTPPLDKITEGLGGLLRLLEHGAVTDAPADDIIGGIIAAQVLAGQLHARVPS